jgi:hypothetical protein
LETLLQNEKDNPAPPEIITPAKYQEVLDSCDEELLPVVVLMGFGGIRREEVLKMSWVNIWELQDCVEVNAREAKTSERRVLERSSVINAWLAPYRQHKGRIWKHSKGVLHHRLDDLREKTELKGKHNVLRHSFGSYRYALTDSADKTAKEMGNSPTTLKKSYYRVATPAQGAEWFNLMPPNHNKQGYQGSMKEENYENKQIEW